MAGYMMLGAVLSLIAVWKAPETFRRDLRATSTAPKTAPEAAPTGH